MAYRRAVELDAGHPRAVINLARLEPRVSNSPGAEEAENQTLKAVADLGGSDTAGL